MKKRIITVVLAFMLITGCLTACSISLPLSDAEDVSETDAEVSAVVEIQPDITQVRSICELATLECYYHNVAKSVKEAGTGITHLAEKDREFWIEYDGTVKLGIDISQVKMSIENNIITITIPEAKVLDVTVNQDSYDEDSYIVEKDSINSNKITAEDATAAVNQAKADMKKTAQENSALLMNAQDRAKELIENYINQIGEATGTDYIINWDYMGSDGGTDADSVVNVAITSETDVENTAETSE